MTFGGDCSERLTLRSGSSSDKTTEVYNSTWET